MLVQKRSEYFTNLNSGFKPLWARREDAVIAVNLRDLRVHCSASPRFNATNIT